MSPHLAKVEAAIDPGLTMLNWTSLSLDAYMDSVYEALMELELLIDRANDLVKFRIEAVLQEMSNTLLCELPSDAPWTIEMFLKNTEVSSSLDLHQVYHRFPLRCPLLTVQFVRLPLTICREPFHVV